MRTSQERPSISPLKPYSLAAQPSRRHAWREPATTPSGAGAAPVRALDGDAWTAVATHLDPQSVLNLVSAIPTRSTAQALRGVRSAVLSRRYGHVSATAQDLRMAKHYFPSGTTRARDWLATPVACPAPLTLGLLRTAGLGLFILPYMLEGRRRRRANRTELKLDLAAIAGAHVSRLSHAIRGAARDAVGRTTTEPTLRTVGDMAIIEQRLNKYLHRAIDRADLGGFLWLLDRGAPLHLPDPVTGRYPEQRIEELAIYHPFVVRWRSNGKSGNLFSDALERATEYRQQGPRHVDILPA